MKNIIKQKLNEEFGKKDVTKEITAFIDSATFKNKIEKKSEEIEQDTTSGNNQQDTASDAIEQGAIPKEMVC